MKKLLLTAVVFAATLMSSKAQLFPSFDLGLKAGLNFSSLKSDGDYFSSDAKAGFLGGVWGRVGILGLHLQPEVYYSSKSSKLTKDETTQDVKFSTIDVPILLGTKIGLGPVGARIQAGPRFSFVVDKDTPKEIFQSNFKDNTSAIIGGIGADISKLTIDLRYEHGLGNFNKNNDKQKLNLWTIALGFKLL